MKTIYLPYSKYEHLINEADVLLFRHGYFPSVGWWIGKYTQSPYSHVGMASWEKDKLNCVEFREFIGSRNEPLKKQIKGSSGRIDVFRPLSEIRIPHLFFNGTNIIEKIEKKKFTFNTAKAITNCAKSFMGQKYGWYNIWKMAKSYTPLLRFWNYNIDDDRKDLIFVCSTLITYAYRQFYCDLCPFLGDDYTNPGDIARSSMLKYMFTLIYG